MHLAELPSAKGLKKTPEGIALERDWSLLFAIRDVVLQELEKARVEKIIGSSLEARVRVLVGKETYERLKKYESQLRFIFIVSQVEFGAGDEDYEKVTASVTVERADGQKCERCWNYSTHVGELSKYPTVCERCVEALEEIEAA